MDASALLGQHRFALIAGAALHYYDAYWSTWISGELVRKRTEWIALRAVREGWDVIETRRRLRESRDRVNAVLSEMTHVFRSVDYSTTPPADLTWLRDPDDWPVMQTALAADAEILITDNSRDFPLGERRAGILLLGSAQFLTSINQQLPDARSAIAAYVSRRIEPR